MRDSLIQVQSSVISLVYYTGEIGGWGSPVDPSIVFPVLQGGRCWEEDKSHQPHSGEGDGEGNPSGPSRGYSEVLWVQYSLVYYTGEGVVLRSLVYYTGDDE